MRFFRSCQIKVFHEAKRHTHDTLARKKNLTFQLGIFTHILSLGEENQVFLSTLEYFVFDSCKILTASHCSFLFYQCITKWQQKFKPPLFRLFLALQLSQRISFPLTKSHGFTSEYYRDHAETLQLQALPWPCLVCLNCSKKNK